MGNLSVWVKILLVVVVNLLILATKDVRLLVLFFLSLYIFGYVTQSRRRIVRKLTTFVFIGISLLIFQLVFNQSVSMVDRVTNALRVTLQIASISQVVFLTSQYISPSSFISALRFLPRSWQLLLGMTFMFVPLLVREQEVIQLVQISRGLGHTWKSKLIAPFAFLIPLIHRIMQRSQIIGYSMTARGFQEN